MPCRRASVLFHSPSDSFKQVFTNYDGHRVGDYNVVIPILADVFAVRQHVLHHIIRNFLSVFRYNAFFVKAFNNVFYQISVGIHRKRFQNNRRKRLIDGKLLIFVNIIAEGDLPAG